MGWCDEFRKHKRKGNIGVINNQWYIINHDYLMLINHCPFCGATLTNNDL